MGRLVTGLEDVWCVSICLVYNGYSLALCALLVLTGAMNDFYGRRRMFAFGVAAFGVMSVLCGAAMNMELLGLFRVLQGAKHLPRLPPPLDDHVR